MTPSAITPPQEQEIKDFAIQVLEGAKACLVATKRVPPSAAIFVSEGVLIVPLGVGGNWDDPSFRSRMFEAVKSTCFEKRPKMVSVCYDSFMTFADKDKLAAAGMIFEQLMDLPRDQRTPYARVTEAIFVSVETYHGTLLLIQPYNRVEGGGIAFDDKFIPQWSVLRGRGVNFLPEGSPN